MRSLNGKTALVTGSSRGIGLAIARELGRSGARIALNYHVRTSEAEAAQESLRREGIDAKAFQADVSDRANVASLVERTLEAFGSIDILVNNAGITRDRTLRKMSEDEWDEVIAVDLGGVFNCTRAVAELMVAAGEGRIVSIASIVGQTGAFGQANYGAAKAGVIGFTKSCALELAGHGITVNAVCPGFIDTEMLAEIPERIREQIRASIPLGRFGTPDEVAACVRFLVAEGSYLTGQCLNPNGGKFM